MTDIDPDQATQIESLAQVFSALIQIKDGSNKQHQFENMNSTGQRHIVILQGHPDGSARHLCHALADSYALGAKQGGHDIRVIDVANLEFPLLRTQVDFKEMPPPLAIRDAQESIRWADHLVIVFPLWLGTMPAVVKGFLEQTMRPGFAFQYGDHGFTKKMLTGRSARMVVTMGMPAWIYRWYFFAHGLRGLDRNILKFVGIGPVRESYFGMVENVSDGTRQKWLDAMHRLGTLGG